MAEEYTKDSFPSEVLGADKPVLVDFWSDGCPPCKRLSPVIDELAVENEGSAGVGKVNVGDNMELAVEYGVSAVPTMLVFKDGKVVERIQGYKDKGELQAVLDKHTVSA